MPKRTKLLVKKVKIRLSSTDQQGLNRICGEIIKIADKTGVKLRGPIPLPTKQLWVPTSKSPCTEGNHTWSRWKMRIHKRLIEVDQNEGFLKRLMRIQTPEKVVIEIELL